MTKDKSEAFIPIFLGTSIVMVVAITLFGLPGGVVIVGLFLILIGILALAFG